MPKTPKAPGALLSLCNSVERMATMLLNSAALNGARLSKIEDRLASLDGGPDAEAAARLALDDVNASRCRDGRPEIKRP